MELERKAEEFHKTLEVTCEKEDCINPGEYIRCYWNKSGDCPKYENRNQNLTEIMTKEKNLNKGERGD